MSSLLFNIYFYMNARRYLNKKELGIADLRGSVVRVFASRTW